MDDGDEDECFLNVVVQPTPLAGDAPAALEFEPDGRVLWTYRASANDRKASGGRFFGPLSTPSRRVAFLFFGLLTLLVERGNSL